MFHLSAEMKLAMLEMPFESREFHKTEDLAEVLDNFGPEAIQPRYFAFASKKEVGMYVRAFDQEYAEAQAEAQNA